MSEVKLCRFSDDGICTVCGVPRSAGSLRNCPAKPWKYRSVPQKIRLPKITAAAKPTPRIKEPGIVRKAASMCASVGRWIRAGAPVRSQEEVARILAICQDCPLILDKGTNRQRCGKCGCPVNGDIENPRKNKIAMATESCPLPVPLWTVAV